MASNKLFVFKKGKLFIWYSNHWINVNLEVSARGGGWKGVKSFIKGMLNCRKGVHQYSTVFFMQDFTSRIQCQYCNKEKK